MKAVFTSIFALFISLVIACSSSDEESASISIVAENSDCIENCVTDGTIQLQELGRTILPGESVFQVRGLGCNYLQYGTGFFVEKDLVVTNAHVVAGVATPIILHEGEEYDLELVSFDPNSDLAILKTGSFTQEPLELDDAKEGETATVVAFVKDGERIISDVNVKEKILAVGKDIFGEEGDSREALSLEASIESGFSGSPVLNSDSSVIGVIFSRSRGGSSTAYAVQSSEVKRIIEKEPELGSSTKCMP